jgi:tRNA G18 (ribose-2'-O)-methylase SpoU
MPVVRLEALDDPRVAEYAAFGDRELVRSRGLFVAEGRLVVSRVVASGRFEVRSLLLSVSAWGSLGSLLDRLAPQVPVYVCRAGDFLGITGFNIHRGCLALVERPPGRLVGDVCCGAGPVVVLEAVTNADNVGGVFRNAAAFGADAVLLSPTCCDPLYRKAIRTSMAATLDVPFARLDRWPDDLGLLRARGFALVALTPLASARSLDEFVAQKPGRVALLVGTEGAGLSDEASACADVHVRIPIRPDIDSLNLAVATGVALSRLTGPTCGV